MPLIINSNGKSQYFTNVAYKLNLFCDELEEISRRQKEHDAKYLLDNIKNKTLDSLAEKYDVERKVITQVS